MGGPLCLAGGAGGAAGLRDVKQTGVAVPVRSGNDCLGRQLVSGDHPELVSVVCSLQSKITC